LGDARLTLLREPDSSFDLIIVDAYTSDSIPVHLATREAMAIYKAKLVPDGVVLMHISNRHLDLSGVVAGIAAANGLQTWVCDDFEREGEYEEYAFGSLVAVAASRVEDIGAMAEGDTCVLKEPDPRDRTWTDDYSNILGAILRKLE
jgi:spermidine synthase